MAGSTKIWSDNNPPSCNADDLNGFKLENNNLIEGAGIVLDTGDNQQTHKAVAHYAGHGDFYNETGVADAYVLSVVGSRVAPPAYGDGMRVRFVAGNANTGASTINVASLGVKDIVLPGGVVLTGGEIQAGNAIELFYDLASGDFVVSSLGTSPFGAFSTGDSKITFKTSPDTGWVLADDGTIGSGASAATNRANDDTLALFTLLWNNISDTYAPVSGGRGASAAADWAANKTIQLGTILGRALSVAGAGSGLTSRALGEALGEETHQLITSEIPAHTHTTQGAVNESSPETGAFDYASSFQGNVTSSSTGGDGAHNNMQPTSFTNLMIKL